jgi:hypothetical protein
VFSIYILLLRFFSANVNCFWSESSITVNKLDNHQSVVIENGFLFYFEFHQIIKNLLIKISVIVSFGNCIARTSNCAFVKVDDKAKTIAMINFCHILFFND